mgnify:CR=1 FL=1
MKAKMIIGTSVFGDAQTMCASMPEIYPKPKVLVCIDLHQISKSLIRNRAVPLRKKEITPESVMSMEVMIPQHNSAGESQTIKIGSIDTEKK